MDDSVNRPNADSIREHFWKLYVTRHLKYLVRLIFERRCDFWDPSWEEEEISDTRLTSSFEALTATKQEKEGSFCEPLLKSHRPLASARARCRSHFCPPDDLSFPAPILQ
jgi:hypothetical protein